MFKNLSSGGLMAAAALLIIAGICALLGFRDNTSHGDGGLLLWCAIGFTVFALIVAAADARRHTKRLEAEAAQRDNKPRTW